MDQGAYVLVINLPERARANAEEIESANTKGECDFESGYYLYVGSANNGLHSTLERHIKKDAKKNCRTHWHIDYLLKQGLVEEIWMFETARNVEPKIAELLSKHYRRPIKVAGDGCECSNQLFYAGLGEDIPQSSTMIDHTLKDELN